MLDLSEPLDVASAIRWCESRLEGVTMPGARRGFAACLLALRFQQEAEKNEPLTLEELLQMDGQPVYITKKGFHGIWALVCCYREAQDGIYLTYRNGTCLAESILNDGAKIYRRPPEREEP